MRQKRPLEALRNEKNPRVVALRLQKPQWDENTPDPVLIPLVMASGAESR